MKDDSKADGNKNPNNDELIEALQTEVEFYKTEHEILRKEVRFVADTNTELNKLLDKHRELVLPQELETHKSVSDHIIYNLRSQIQLLNEEKLTLQNLWRASQETVNSLESEIKEYLTQFKGSQSTLEIRKSYDNTVRVLEVKVSQLQNEMQNAKVLHMNLEKSKQLCEQKLVDLDQKHNELLIEYNSLLEQVKRTEEFIKNRQNENALLLRDKQRLEQRLAVSESAQKASRAREMIAYNKIQEALNVADAAIAEKNAALTQEKDIRDERDQLAISITQVMEEAGNKVESDVEIIKKKYNDKIRALRNVLSEANSRLEVQSNCATTIEQNAKGLQARLKELISANETLDSDLQIASKTIIELEIKLQAYEKLMAREQEITQNAEDQTIKIRDFYDTNKRFKEKWKHIFEEMIEKLQIELRKSQAEHSALKMENLNLKTILEQFGEIPNKIKIPKTE